MQNMCWPAGRPPSPLRDTHNTMSEPNVELVREAIALMNGGENGELSPRLLDLFADEVQVDMSRRLLHPDVYRGHPGLRRLRREVPEVWDGFLLTPERIMDAGESVMVIDTQRVRGSAAGGELVRRSAVIWTVRNGRIIRVEVGLDPQEALELVRLREFL
jgi:ketosteroid isomerase-like protein